MRTTIKLIAIFALLLGWVQTQAQAQGSSIVEVEREALSFQYQVFSGTNRVATLFDDWRLGRRSLKSVTKELDTWRQRAKSWPSLAPKGALGSTAREMGEAHYALVDHLYGVVIRGEKKGVQEKMMVLMGRIYRADQAFSQKRLKLLDQSKEQWRKQGYGTYFAWQKKVLPIELKNEQLLQELHEELGQEKYGTSTQRVAMQQMMRLHGQLQQLSVHPKWKRVHEAKLRVQLASVRLAEAISLLKEGRPEEKTRLRRAAKLLSEQTEKMLKGQLQALGGVL